MSQLIGPSNPGSKLDPELQARMDAPLMALAQQSGGDLRNMLGAFFSFLNRRTDFYYVPHPDDIAEAPDRLKMGFKEGDAEKLLLASFRQFPLRRLPKGVAVKKSEEPSSVPQKPESNTKQKDDSEGDGKNVAGKGEQPEVRLSEDGKQIPVGNGGCSIKKGYHWTQTIEEISIAIPVEKSTKGKDLNVNISSSSIAVCYKGKSTSIVEGKLPSKVRPSESTWSIEGGVLVLVLEKIQKNWWESALEGDEEIDTDLIDSTRKISEYDDATQGAIRKIMFDQQQQRQGLPTSDEILGVMPKIPSTLPSGVEFIDSETLDKNIPK